MQQIRDLISTSLNTTGVADAIGISNAPNLVVIHGWKSSSLKSAENLIKARFLKMGFHLWFMELPHHITRQEPESLFSGERMITADVERTVRSVRQAVNDAYTLIQWLKRNHGKVILAGISLGGLVSNLLATMTDIPDGLVSILPATDLARLIWYSPIGKNVGRDLRNNGIRYSELASAWSCLNPARKVPQIPKDRILLLTGKYDRFIPQEDADLLWSSWDKPLRTILPIGHSGLHYELDKIGVEMAHVIDGWMEKMDLT